MQAGCASFLVPDHSLHTVHVAQILSPEVWAQHLSVTNSYLRVIVRGLETENAMAAHVWGVPACSGRTMMSSRAIS